MLNTFDRYLLRRYISTFLIMFVSTYGLFVVIDGFTNADEYFQGEDSTIENLKTMGEEYLFRASSFFDMTGSILSVVTVIIVLGLLLYQKEIHPLLAAGIPSYRLSRPLLLGALVANLLMVANTELILPKVSLLLESSRGEGLKAGKVMEPVQDYELHINLDGNRMFASDRSIRHARFILTAPTLVEELTTLSAAKAVYYPEVAGKHPSGWRLKKVTPPIDQVKLTKMGQKNIFRLKNSEDIFVATEVSFHQVYSKGGNYLYDTTPELIERVNSPALSQASISRQILFLHNRLARPIQNLVAVMLLIPFVMHKDSRSLITSMAIACGVLVGMLAVQQLANYLASAKIVTPDFAVWIPILMGGGLAAWFSEDILT
ncbi:MAG: LptF/LptG family permease [Planctomycetaceae bacterium]|nr:LptF/LptG family permease [Planctomycetaceae bacterium]